MFSLWETLHMRILHLFNTAGVPTLLSQYMRTQGHTSQVLTTRASDKFSQTDPGAWVVSRARWFYLKSILEAHNFDLLVVHANARLISYLKYLKRPLVLYCHGSELRSWPGRVISDLQWGDYKHVIVATPDLLDLLPDIPEEITYIPNPVSPMFKPGPPPAVPRAFTFSYGADLEALDLAREKGLDLDILQRTFKWRQMPDLFKGYSHYIDIKRDHLGEMLIRGEVLSMTALEALASGLTVLTQEREVRGLPPKHQLENSGKIFLETVSPIVRN